MDRAIHGKQDKDETRQDMTVNKKLEMKDR